MNKECTRRKNTKCTPERDMNGSKRVFTVPPKPTVTGATTGATSNTSLRRTTRKNRLKSSSKPSSTVSGKLLLIHLLPNSCVKNTFTHVANKCVSDTFFFSAARVSFTEFQ